ncbi:RagB/SusD family nutrient uptake outer membrane protein [Cytophaga sp. FL35]|uniref:RagB/SusD family nutrient uptake outer membrane protein n=1 Tax=Cytophaga sp. FL35 TaxID=1904456 RepID=UPI0016538231|nr:RagB/SusD family nutrient uptake outer membrane protein [Cytophaga sp. FL35]MBC7000329.1 RagB/SusD family nutrient uptake outer membrane protein [Cytophaga sp. FL35]
MKTYIKRTLILSISIFIAVSCSEDEFLKEEPLDFFDPANSFVTLENFESSLADLYAKYRYIFYTGDSGGFFSFSYQWGTDILKNARDTEEARRFGNYVSTLDPTGSVPEWHWDRWYKIIANANTIIAKLDNSELTDKEKIRVEGEARLFRALSYRHLVYLYGGVPLVLEELSEPKTDFTRASKDDVLNQIIIDATFAATNLPDIAEVDDGKLCNLVAQHLLAETYISLDNFDEAIAAASVVIENPSTALMTDRFGSRAGEMPGDVYWDLFRRGNQNRSSGNLESLWVAQIEHDIPGGLLTTDENSGNLYERYHSPVTWTLNDPDGNPGMLGPRSDLNVAGRGVSFLRPTAFFEDDLWLDNFDNDIRNAPHNYVRDVIYDNPESAWFGKSAKDNPGPTLLNQDWRWYPHLSKVTTPGNHPANVIADPTLNILKNSAGPTFSDAYYLRLAETYLLRAEAYLGKGEMGNAAADINRIRERSNALPVTPGEVDLDFILDERARELAMEEQRRITLQRVDKLVERVRLYNDLNTDDILDHHNIWPIPAKEIEANINGKLEQNPGY